MSLDLTNVPDGLKVLAVSRIWGATRVGFSRKETSILLGISIRSVDYLLSTNRLSSFNLGSRRMVTRDSIIHLAGHGVLGKMVL